MHLLHSDTPLGRLFVEYSRIREHNQRRAYDAGSMPLAEGALGIICIERFLRVILGDKADDSSTLANLLDKATSAGSNAIDPPIRFAYLPDPRGTNAANRDISTEVVAEMRNPLLHGNYEQAARLAGVPSAAEYVLGDSYRADLESINQALVSLLRQFDRDGVRIEPTDRTRENDEEALHEARERLVHALGVTSIRTALR